MANNNKPSVVWLFFHLLVGSFAIPSVSVLHLSITYIVFYIYQRKQLKGKTKRQKKNPLLAAPFKSQERSQFTLQRCLDTSLLYLGY